MILKGTIPLSTKRLNLRKIKLVDYECAYKNIYSNSKIADETITKKHVSPLETKSLFEYYEIEYINLYTYRWIIEEKETEEVIGIVEIIPSKYSIFDVYEVGYCISEKSWNKGYATEALNEVIKFMFEEIDVNVIYAESPENNKASQKVLEKVNMKYEGLIRNRMTDNKGQKVNLKSYSIIKEQYQKK